MTSDPGSNAPNGEARDDERTIDDVTQGLEDVVRMNRVQHEALAEIKRDFGELTQRIKEGNLLLLPRSHFPHAISHRKRTRE